MCFYKWSWLRELLSWNSVNLTNKPFLTLQMWLHAILIFQNHYNLKQYLKVILWQLVDLPGTQDGSIPVHDPDAHVRVTSPYSTENPCGHAYCAVLPAVRPSDSVTDKGGAGVRAGQSGIIHGYLYIQVVVNQHRPVVVVLKHKGLNDFTCSAAVNPYIII